jgi:hypothetical protein
LTIIPSHLNYTSKTGISNCVDKMLQIINTRENWVCTKLNFANWDNLMYSHFNQYKLCKLTLGLGCKKYSKFVVRSCSIRKMFEKSSFDSSSKLISNQTDSIRNYIESNSNHSEFVRNVFANYFCLNLY